MIYIKRFVDRVSLLESKQSKDFVIPISEARGLRDELTKILADCYAQSQDKKPIEEPNIKIEFKGGTFR